VRKIISFLLLICLFPVKVNASDGYEEITGGTINVTLHLVDSDKHERSIFDNSHFVLDIQGEENSEFETGEGSVFYSTPVSDELRNTGKTLINVNLSGLRFNKPAVYKYAIHGYFTSYNTLERDTVYHLTDNEYEYLYVYVVDNNGELEIDSYVIGDGVKEFEYYGKLATNTLEVKKVVKGNQASVFQKFNVTISVKRAIPNMTYNLGEEHKLVTDSKGNGTTTLPLGHNQVVRITDLPIGSSYTVSEDEEDYIQTTEGKTSWLFRTPDQKQVVVFTNKKDGLIPTGILLNNGTILIGIGLISILALKLRRKKRYEN
jgi:hypothetical protein